MVPFVIGVDVGGTNTDTVILSGKQVIAKGKTPTTQDKTHGIINSIQSALNQLCHGSEEATTKVLSALARVSIGTTHFTNAVKKRDGSSLDKVAIIRLCGPSSRALPPFSDFPEDLMELMCGGGFMVSGGLEYDSSEISAVREEEVRACVRDILQKDPPVRNVVISGVFAPCDNPCGRQEKEVEEIIKSESSQLSCTLSHELGTLGLLERENAAVLNESLKSLAKMTVEAFQKALENLGIFCPFFLTQNDGTMISAEEAIKFPVLTFSSGPTNSMRGAAYLSGLCDAIVVDIGGTTTDVGVLKNGFPRESSANFSIGGVGTNFCMPDVQSIALGGGSLIKYNSQTGEVQVGPDSVEYRIRQEALCFGGAKCTATDIALAAGVAPLKICTAPQALSGLTAKMVYSVMREIKTKIETMIDMMKTEKDDVPVIIVGGGCILVDSLIPLKGVSRVIVPTDHWDVANAVGAALGTVGGASDLVVNLVPIRESLVKSHDAMGVADLEHRAREEALKRGREAATEEVIKKIKNATGDITDALRATIYTHSEEVLEVTYVSDRVRVKVKTIGALTEQDAEMSLPARNSSAAEEGSKVKCDLPQVAMEQRDKSSWPYSSSQDEESDKAANLPEPHLVGGGGGRGPVEWLLSAHDIECLALGAAILGCGGGGDPYSSRLRAAQLLKEGKIIRVLNPCRVDVSEMGLLCAVAFMGAPVILIEKLVRGDESVLALTRVRQAVGSGVCEGSDGRAGDQRVSVKEETYQYYDGTSFSVHVAEGEDLKKIDITSTDIPLNQRITGLMCAEAGGFNSIEPLLVGACTDLPVLDVDGMGRAFPELQMYIPFIYGCGHCPSSLADCKGEAITCTHAESSLELEKFFRMETVRMGMSAGIATGVMDYKTMLNKAVLFTLSQAWQLGRAVLRARITHSPILPAIADQQHGLILITGKVVSVDRESSGGFTKVISVVEGLDTFAGHQVKVQAKNENYIVQKLLEGKGEELHVLACTPDLISIVDSNTGTPVTTEQVRYGLRVGVVILPANPLLKTPRALKVVGPRGFGFDFDYREPTPLL